MPRLGHILRFALKSTTAVCTAIALTCTYFTHRQSLVHQRYEQSAFFVVSYGEVTDEQLIVKYNPTLVEGRFTPQNGAPRERVAVIVPYRDRRKTLMEFLDNLPVFLLKQKMEFAIFVIEPIGNQTFNRAKLLNIGFQIASKDPTWNCFVFHDVDLLPENLNNHYKCRDTPVHLASALDTANYSLPYPENFGGVSMFSREQFLKINGFSNDYWGYAGEDDDSYYRLLLANYTVWRYPESVAHYKMKRHRREASNPLNPCRYELIARVGQRFWHDGLNSLNYRLVKYELRQLYQWYLVDLLEAEGKSKMETEGLCKWPLQENIF